MFEFNKLKMSVDSEFCVKSVRVLNGKNFSMWKGQMYQVFIHLDLIDIVTGKTTRPLDEAKTPDEQKSFDKLNAKAMITITSTIDDEQYKLIENCTTAKHIWDKLHLIHEQKSELSKNVLWQKFHQAHFEPGESILCFTTKIQKLARQLKDLKQEVSDESLMAKIIMSLPDQYNAFRSAWDSTEPTRQTIENLESRLIKEEANLSKGQISQQTALVSDVQPQRGNNHHRQGGNQRPNRYKGQNPHKDTICNYCQNKGHIERKCRQKHKDFKEFKKVNKSSNGNHHQQQQNTRSNSNQANFAGALIATVEPQIEHANAICRIAEGSDFDLRDVWVADSGATCHMTCRRDWFTTFKETPVRYVSQGNNSVCEAIGEGTIVIKRFVNGKWFDGCMDNVLYVPDFKKNLYATDVATERGIRVIIDKGLIEFQHKISNEIVAQGKSLSNKLRVLYFEVVVPNTEANTSCLKTLHESLGHVNKTRLRKMLKDKVIDGADEVIDKDFFCEACVHGKMHRLPHYHEKEHKEDQRYDVGECLYTDLCGPMSVSLGGSKYFMLVKDRKSSYLFVYFLKDKTEAVAYLKNLYQHIKISVNKSVKMVRTDNGLEFCNQSFKQFLFDNGAILGNSAPYCQQQNGRIERENRTVVESARSMLHQNNEPKYLWAEAVNAAVYALNRTTTASNSKCTPFELWHKKKPNISHMRPFGTEAFVLVPKMHRSKFDSNAMKGILVGYQDTTEKNYRICNEARTKVLVARDVQFNDEKAEEQEKLNFIFKNISVPSVHVDVSSDIVESPAEPVYKQTPADNCDYCDMHDVSISQHTEESQVEPVCQQTPADEHSRNLRRGCKRKLQTSAVYCDRNLRDRSLIKIPKRYQSNFAEVIEPNTYEEAVSGYCNQEWQQAIEEEFTAHEKNNSWTIVQNTGDLEPLDSVCVFKVKRNPDNSVKNFKARLCIRGCKQQQGVDYNETFSPVVRYDSLRILLAVAAQLDLEIVQFDIRSAFLYGELEEEIYVKVPKGMKVLIKIHC